MKNNTSVFSISCTVLLIFMWTYAGLSKLFMYEATRFDWLSHELIKNYSSTLAWLVPVIELFIVSLLIFPKTKNAGAWLSVTLLSFFTLYIIYMFNFYTSTPCSCGGVIKEMTWKQHIAFNLFFIGLSILSMNKKRIHDHETERPGPGFSGRVSENL